VFFFFDIAQDSHIGDDDVRRCLEHYHPEAITGQVL